MRNYILAAWICLASVVPAFIGASVTQDAPAPNFENEINQILVEAGKVEKLDRFMKIYDTRKGEIGYSVL